MDKPVLSDTAFKDIDMDSLDYEIHAQYVIEKVVDRGSFEDFITLKKFYGDDRFRKEVVKTTWLGPKEINFCCVVFNLKPTDFKFIPKRIKFLPLGQSKSYYNI